MLNLNQIKHKILHNTPLKRPVPNDGTGLFNGLFNLNGGQAKKTLLQYLG